MSNDSNECDQTSFLRRPMPLWLAAMIVGAFLGGLGTYQVMRAVGYDVRDLTNTGEAGDHLAEMRAKMEQMMRRTIMSMMGGGIANEQRSLTALVGKLDLLSHGVCIELEPEQAEKLASTLAKLDQAEEMTSDEAQGHFDAIQALLTEEQKASSATIDLPHGGPSDNGDMRGSDDAPPGPGATPPNGAGPLRGMMGSGMLSPPTNENPFQQEINQTRLHDFLDRLRQSSVESSDITEESKVTGTQETTATAVKSWVSGE